MTDHHGQMLVAALDLMGPRKICTAHIYPPIPCRDFDWCAYFDGEEERGQYGYGRTEAEAKQDLIDSYGEDE